MRNQPGWILALACVLIVSGSARLRAQDVDKGKEESKAIKAMVEAGLIVVKHGRAKRVA